MIRATLCFEIKPNFCGRWFLSKWQVQGVKFLIETSEIYIFGLESRINVYRVYRLLSVNQISPFGPVNSKDYYERPSVGAYQML